MYVDELPLDKSVEALTSRLSQLSTNCGGKPESVSGGKGLIRFGCKEDAQRCLHRINGADVFGRKILVAFFEGDVQTFGQNSGRHRSRGQQRRNRDKSNTTAKTGSQAGGPNCSLSSQNSTQNQYSDDNCKSVIKGLETLCEENVTKTVRKLIQMLNDRSVNPNFVANVERDRKFAQKDGFALLFVTAVSPEKSRALIASAKKLLDPSVQWTPYRRKQVVKTEDVAVPQQFYSKPIRGPKRRQQPEREPSPSCVIS